MVLIKDLRNRSRGPIRSFPSPCGDYGSYRNEIQSVRSLTRHCFRPLAGIMVLITFFFCGHSNQLLKSFRPLAGIMVLINVSNWLNECFLRRVSVPLRGLWFLSIESAVDMLDYKPGVSVPLRGLWFLSLSY